MTQVIIINAQETVLKGKAAKFTWFKTNRQTGLKDIRHNYKFISPDGMHSQALRELADIIVRPISIIFGGSWQWGEVPEDWGKANITPIFKKVKKENPGNYRPVSRTLIPGKAIPTDPGNYFQAHEGQAGKVLPRGSRA